MVNLNCSKEESRLAAAIANRAVAVLRRHGERIPRGMSIDTQMDIIAVHLNDCSLRLPELAKSSDDFNLLHDVLGIRKHLDRATGKLGDCFVPRYAAPHSGEKVRYY